MFEALPVIFVLTSLLIIITPGQDLVLVMSRSISQGSKAGVATAAGVSVGLMGHTLLATIGLGAILSSSAFLFTAIKLIGAVYLVYLGIKLLKSDHTNIGISGMTEAPLRRLFVQGAVSNISNPKITIFYFAYLPQFLPPDGLNHTTHLFFLGTFFALLTFFVKAPIGYGAGRLSSWLRTHPKVITLINRISGGLLVGLGLRLAFTSRT
jgi:threonine/homoserine/homoserine lactone efflux protein